MTTDKHVEKQLAMMELLALKDTLKKEEKDLVRDQLNFRKRILLKDQQANKLLVAYMSEQEVNLQFLIKESDDDDSEYGEELLNKITFSGEQAIKDMKQHPSTKIMVNSGSNDFVQAVFQSLISFPSLLNFFLLKDYSDYGTKGKQPLCQLLNYLCTTYFLKDLKGLEQTRFDLDFIRQFLAPTSFSLKARAHAGGFLKYVIQTVQAELGGSDFVQLHMRAVVNQYFVCANDHIQKNQKANVLPPMIKVPQGFSILEFFRNRMAFSKAVDEGEKCPYCQQSITKSKVRLREMPPILIFKFANGNNEGLQEIFDLSEFAEDVGARFKYEVTAMIKFDSIQKTMYTTFVRRNHLTAEGTIKMDWLEFSKDSFRLSSWEEAISIAVPEVVMLSKKND